MPKFQAILDAISIHKKHNQNQNKIPDINIGIVGKPIEYEHANQSQQDTGKM